MYLVLFSSATHYTLRNEEIFSTSSFLEHTTICVAGQPIQFVN